MSLTWAAFLGLVQGLTEFLPVSSSGHLVILQGLTGLKTPGVTFEVAVHLGTLLAVLIALWPDVRGLLHRRRLSVMILIALVPTGIIGLLGKELFEQLFSSPRAAAWGLIVTGTLLQITPRLSRGRTGLLRVRGCQALAIGTAQGLAIVPGLSRSGVTITAGLACGLDPDAAARFSFLVSIPAILGAAAVDTLDVAAEGALAVRPAALLVGALTATLVGIASVRWMLQLVRQGRLRSFAYYCWAVGVVTLLATLVRPS